jgi:hypothetical protein
MSDLLNVSTTALNTRALSSLLFLKQGVSVLQSLLKTARKVLEWYLSLSISQVGSKKIDTPN